MPPAMPNAAMRSGSAAGVTAAERLERADHVLAAREAGAAGVGAEFAPPREPHDDHGRQEGKHELGDHRRDPECRAVAALVAEHDLVDDVADQARGDEHEGVHHALDQCQGDHVAIGDVADLVAEHGLDLAAGSCGCSRPVLTATSAVSRRAPVAKALGSGESK